jgi:hypothetical protein
MENPAMNNAFKSKRAILWLAAIAVLVLGFLVAAVVLPARAPTPGAGGPDIHVPKMQNVPPEGAPHLKLDVDKKPAPGE